MLISTPGMAVINSSDTPSVPTTPLRKQVLLFLGFVFSVTLIILATGVSQFVRVTEANAWHDRQLRAVDQVALATLNLLDQAEETLIAAGYLDPVRIQSHPDTLHSLLTQNPALLEIVIFAPDGVVLAAANDDRPILANLPDIARAAWFAQAITTPYLGRVSPTQQIGGQQNGGEAPLQTPINPGPFGYLILAVPTPQGRVITGRLSLTALTELTRAAHLALDGDIYLAAPANTGSTGAGAPDSTGPQNLKSKIQNLKSGAWVIAHSDPAQANLPWAVPDLQQGADLRRPTTGQPESPYLTAEYRNPAGVLLTAVAVPLAGADWLIVSELPKARLYATSRGALSILAADIVVFALLVMGFTVWLLDRQLFRPLAALHTGVGRIGQGDLSFRISQPAAGTASSEIGRLAGDINDMAARLQTREQELLTQKEVLAAEVAERRRAEAALQVARAELERRVIERTEELRTANSRLAVELEDRRQAQAALASAQTRLSHVLSTSPVVLYSLDPNHDFDPTFISDNAASVGGYTPQEILAEPNLLIDRVHPEDREMVWTATEQMGNLAHNVLEYRFMVKSGEYRWFHDERVIVRDDAGLPLEVVGSVLDITERKAADKVREEAREEARRLAEQASRLKSEFLATVSHEVRTPMNGIIGTLDLLLTTSLAPDQLDFVHTIYGSANSMLAIVNDLLDLSKIEAGRLNLENRLFDPGELVEEVIGLMAGRAAAKALLLAADPMPDLPPRIIGDPLRLRQVLMNLVSNAIKFTDRGSVTLSAELVTKQLATQATENAENTEDIEKTKPEEARVPIQNLKFTVRDTGIGMSTDDMSRLFLPFSQLAGATAERGLGTGLGLAICKRLVDLMGGEIGVESALGTGSAFWFTIPFLKEEGGKTKDEADKVVGNPGIRATLTPSDAQKMIGDLTALLNATIAPGPPKSKTQAPKSKLVLLVEDNPVNQKVAAAQLRNLGYTAVVVGSGAEALNALYTQPFALILMDCHMPEMDGFEATRRIRAQEQHTHAQDAGIPDASRSRRIPIIAMTASAMHGDREACIAAGMDDFLPKPVRLEHLRAMLIRWTGEY